jgi:tetratricopeptide (TPR) repeat protein
VSEFLKALPVVASSPLAFVGYIVLVISWLIIGLKERRNKNLLENLEKFPEGDRLAAWETETDRVRIRHGLSGEQWIRARRQRYLFIGFGITLSVVVALFILALTLSWDKARGDLRLMDVPITGVTSASEEAFRADLSKRSKRQGTEALDYFRAAERDFNGNRFVQAVDNYKQSIVAVPTVPAYLNLGVSYECISQFELAIQVLNEGLRIVTDEQSVDYQAAFHNDLAHVYESQGQFNLAYEHAKTAFDLSRENVVRSANAQITLARIDDDRGKFDDELKQANAALNIYVKLKDKTGIAVAHNTLGNAFLGKGMLRQSFDEFQLALSTYQASGDTLGQVRSRNNIGNAYGDQSQYSEAIQAFEEGLRLARSIGNRYEEANILNNIGDVLREQHADLRSAEKYASEAFTIYSEIGSAHGKAIALLNLGNIHTRQGMYAKARQDFNDAIVLYRQSGDPVGEANATGNIADVLREQQHYAESLQYSNSVLTIFTKIGDLLGEANTYLTLGETYIALKKPERALDSYANAMEVSNRSGNRTRQASALAGKADAEFNLGQLVTAQNDSESAQVMFRSLDDVIGEASAIATMGLIHEQQGKKAEALRELLNAQATYQSKGVKDSRLLGINAAVKRLRH